MQLHKNNIQHEEVEFSETTGLTAEQLRILKNTKCLFRYNENWRIYWDIFMIILALFNWFIIPVQVAFDPPELDNTATTVVDALIDFLFFIDIIIMFRTTYLDSYTGEEIIEPRRIAWNYLKGRFWFDLLATIPIDLITTLSNSNSASELKLFGILKLIRITRLNRLIQFLNAKADVKLILKLIKLIFYLSIYFHFLACLWFYIVNQKKQWIPPLDYIYITTTFFQQGNNYKYWMSLYHAILIETSNDIGPRFETIQVAFCAIIILIGAIVNAYIFGSIVVLVAVMNEKSAQFVHKLDICNTAMKNLKIPKDIQNDVVGYLTYTQALLDSQQELETFLGLVSPSIKEKIIKHIFSQVLKDSEVFKGNEGLVDSLTRKLVTKIYQPEENIITQGEEGSQLFFIARGGCNVYIRNKVGVKIKANTLGSGDLFGEVALLNGWRRTATVKASNYSTIAYLTKENFNHIFNKDAGSLKILKEGRKKYQDEWKVFLKSNLKNIDYMKRLPNEVIEEISYYLKEEFYESESIIFEAGAPVDKVYFILKGEVEILVKINKKEAMLDTLYQACNIGEYGVLGDYCHTFTAQAKTNQTHLSCIIIL